MNQQSMNQAGQAQAQQQSQVMNEPPAIMTTKDLLYVNDMLAWNLNAMKKAHDFASRCQDTEIKQAIESAGQMHERHYEQLLTCLQPSQSQPTQMQ
ncbi:hypothetical protein [Shouchella shacheensis]|uniref:hypothetical protein n=1 Tax=Shouchella shacheensis TaxID=1649580 RepID=UPI00073FB042|nr:hypothetical protein [Shouchella shacheensis]